MVFFQTNAQVDMPATVCTRVFYRMIVPVNVVRISQELDVTSMVCMMDTGAFLLKL